MPPTAPVVPSERWRRAERTLVVLIALHSAAIGLVALFATTWGLRLAGFEGARPLLFPRQVGIFHLLAACAYSIEYFRYRGVSILLTSKGLAVAFLAAIALVEELPRLIPLAAAGDAAMAIAVMAVRARTTPGLPRGR